MNKPLIARCAALCVFVAAGSARADGWTGFSAGVNGGATLGLSDVQTTVVYSNFGYFANTSTVSIAASGAHHLYPVGFTGGVQGGYSYQFRQLVFGGELDFGAMSLNAAELGSSAYPCCAPTSYTTNQTIQTNGLATLRPRVGWSFGSLLAYATGGIATTQLSYHATFDDTYATAHEDAAFTKILFGWVVGAGAEYRVWGHFSVKLEYLFTDFGRTAISSDNLTAYAAVDRFPLSVFTHSATLDGHTLRLGVNYRF